MTAGSDCAWPGVATVLPDQLVTVARPIVYSKIVVGAGLAMLQVESDERENNDL